MEYFEENIARVIRSIRDSATFPLSSALLGMNPQQTVANTMASKSGEYSRSNGQLRKTEVEGLRASEPAPKCWRCPKSEVPTGSRR